MEKSVTEKFIPAVKPVRTRKKSELPVAIDADGEMVPLKEIAIAGLETAMNMRKETLASIDKEAVKRLQLEIRAIKKEVRERMR